jgi:hypothetical protein
MLLLLLLRVWRLLVLHVVVLLPACLLLCEASGSSRATPTTSPAVAAGWQVQGGGPRAEPG